MYAGYLLQPSLGVRKTGTGDMEKLYLIGQKSYCRKHIHEPTI